MISPPRFISLLLVFATLIMGGCASDAPDVEIASETRAEIESFGFTPRAMFREGERIDYFLSTGGRPLDMTQRRPLLVYVQGSTPAPVYFGEAPRFSTSLMFGPRDFPDHHYVVLSKPGVPFVAPERRVESPEYIRRNALEQRVDDTVAVIERLVREDWVDDREVFVVGHSEGADVGPWIAARSPRVTRLAVLAVGAVSQMYDFILEERKSVLRGEQTADEADRKIAETHAAYRKIFADPNSTTKTWRGETYRRWSTFFRPGLDALVTLDIPIYAAVGRHDVNTPVESGDMLPLEFIRRGKDNLTFECWPTDHYFQQPDGRDRLEDLTRRVREWARE